MTPMTRRLLLSGLALFAFGGEAFAHAHLKTATPPADGSVKSAPSELDLTFTEGLELKFSGVKVTGQAKKAVATGKAVLKSGDDATLVVPVAASMPAGRYTVDWHVLSTDGHKTNGSYAFTVAP